MGKRSFLSINTILGALFAITVACSNPGSDPVPNNVARVLNHSTGQAVGQVIYNSASNDPIDIRASDYAGVDKTHIIIRKKNLGSIVAMDLTSGNVRVNQSSLSGADIIVLNGGTDYSDVENGRIAYGRNPTWSWRNDAQGYIPTAEEISFVEAVSNEFSAILSSVPGLPYGSFTKTSSTGTIEQMWYNTPGQAYGQKWSNIIGYNAAEIRPNTALAKSVINAENGEMMISLDDIGGKDSRLSICNSSGDINQTGKDKILYVLVKE